MSDEDVVPPIPNQKLPQWRFVAGNDKLSSSQRQQALSNLLKGVEADEMAPYLESLYEDPSLQLVRDTALLDRLRQRNEEELKKLDERIEDAQQNLGETEVSDALRAKASYLARIGEKERAMKAHKVALEKQAGLGSRMDLVLSQIRIGLFHGDPEITTASIAKAKDLVNDGGDWDRRNRLKVYEGVWLLSIRDFKTGGSLLLDALSTFTASEIIDYVDFVTLTVLANMIVLKRPDIKKKLIDSPEVLQVVDEVPHLRDFTTSLYNTDYAKFFRALGDVEETHIIPSRIFAPHARYYVREMRIIAYAQLLESYRSLTMANMCQAFGVGEEFMDAELSRFISAGRLNAVIDKVNNIIETNRPDAKNAQYEQVVKQGDVLLNSIHKLSRVI